MDARIKFVAIVVVFFLLGADYSTKNFVVSAPDPQLAKQVATAAEKYRHDLAIQWLGAELPQWSEKCPVTVRLEAQAGGQTSFGFASDGSRSTPVGWQMEVYGSPERILDSVLPHEVTHTIFATHFGRPLPRWADEGACTTVEHESERNKNHDLLLRFLTTNRGIPFNQMFVMKQYPHDIYPLYAQGYSLARFLIMQRGRRHFLNYVGAGMTAEQPGIEPRAWDAVTKKYYGYSDLSELQVRWVQWVKQGSPNLSESRTASVAPAERNASAPNPIAQVTIRTAQTAQESADKSWYATQVTNGGSVEQSFPGLQIEVQPAVAPIPNYRPGSIRASQPIEVLATVSPISISANRINPESKYIARPNIEASRKSPPTIWR